MGTGATNRVGSVIGARADQGNITIDGIDANDQATGQFAATVGNAPIDSIQEFRTVTTNPGAAEGRSSGGQILMVTKSGANTFTDRCANTTGPRRLRRTPFSTTNRQSIGLTPAISSALIDPPLCLAAPRRGGPAVISGKNKLFFFFDYEGRRDAQGIAYLRTVPLNHFRSGGLAYLNNTAGCPTNARLDTRPECITILTPAQVAALDPKESAQIKPY